MKKVVLGCFLFFTFGLSAQQIIEVDTISIDSMTVPKFSYKQLILPAVLIGYGTIGIESDQLKIWNTNIRDEVKEDIDKKTSIDDFSQWSPAASVFVLDAFDVKAKHNLRDRTVIFATSYAIMASTVLSLKSNTKINRPDGSSNNSFPSGHTATAFAGAEFLWQEYKDKSIWYGIGGYAIATGTGLFRIYNNRHWLTDVAAGAGIGILSTKIAYWLNPAITQVLFDKSIKEKKTASFIIPSYDGKTIGLRFIKNF